MDASGNMPLLWSGWRSKWDGRGGHQDWTIIAPAIFCIYIGIPGGDDLCREIRLEVAERDPERVDEHGTQTKQGPLLDLQSACVDGERLRNVAT